MDKDYIPFFSSLVVIALFIIDRWIGSRIRKRELKRTWYFKVLLEPKLSSINIFFENIEAQYDKSANILRNPNLSISNSIISQRNEIQIFKDLKRKFELDVIKPIAFKYKETSQDLYTVLREIEDTYTESLDNLQFSMDEINDVVNNIYELKADLLTKLYTPLNK